MKQIRRSRAASIITLRVLVVLIVFFAMGFGMYALAVSESPTFFTQTMTGSGPNGNTVPNPSSLLVWNMTNAIQMNRSNPYIEYDISGWGFTAWSYRTNVTTDFICVESFDKTWGFWDTNREDFQFIDINGTERTIREDVMIWGVALVQSHLVVPLSTLDYIYWSGMGPPSVNMSGPLSFTLKNGKTNLEVTFTFNQTKYVYPSNALVGDGLYVSIRQDFSDRKTSINIIALLGGLFAFNILGVPYPISTLISFIWYGCVGALTYVIITIVRSFIPTLGGGD